MKKLLFVFICTVCMMCTSLAQTSNLTHDIKSSQASAANKSITVVCQGSIDAAGHKTTVMIQSTGSKALDDYIEQYTARFLDPRTSASIAMSVPCQVVKVSTLHGKIEVKAVALRPPYPYQARARFEQGRGLVKASFDENGHVIGAEMAPSTGSKLLDENTLAFARASWRSSGGAKVTTTFPIVYQLQR